MNALAEKIAAEIMAQGGVTFERFMALALYCPDYGYYEREEDRIGTGGDYYTSVSVGSLFGELLGRQFADWVESRVPGPGSRVERPEAGRGLEGSLKSEVQLVEAGAHGGELARDILGWLKRRRAELFGRLEYVVVEPSARRRGWQRRTLEEFGEKVRWVENLAELAQPGVSGVIFCNELLDAMPVRRLGWDAKARKWFEWGVGLEQGKFVWIRMDWQHGSGQTAIRNPQCAIPPGAELERVLPDGFTVEVGLAAGRWWREAAGALRWGRLVGIDYGLSEQELFVPERTEGTLRAYRQHRVSGAVLERPGEQDITAHVDFSAIQQVGEAAGLETEVMASQGQFLTGIAARAWQAGELWDAKQRRRFQTLTHPEHLGRAFRVLVQARI